MRVARRPSVSLPMSDAGRPMSDADADARPIARGNPSRNPQQWRPESVRSPQTFTKTRRYQG
ncbi:hypothetical protein T210_0128180 [Burkholderia pseudomallei MSHR6137]|nr:hypothetical protein T210_0128180 [Burkholderia pseudomallei MSHR6137]